MANAITSIRPAGGQPDSRWYESPYPYIGAMLLVLAVFDLLGRNNPVLRDVSGMLTFLYVMLAGFLVFRTARAEGLLHVLLILLIPFYGIYFVFFVNKDKSLMAMWASGWIAIVQLFLINPRFG